MSQIKYLVMGISNEEIGKLISTLALGELAGEAHVLVSPLAVPKVYSINAGGYASEVKFENFIAEMIRDQRNKQLAQRPGERLVREVVGKLNANQNTGSQPGPAKAVKRPANRGRVAKSG